MDERRRNSRRLLQDVKTKSIERLLLPLIKQVSFPPIFHSPKFLYCEKLESGKFINLWMDLFLMMNPIMIVRKSMLSCSAHKVSSKCISKKEKKCSVEELNFLTWRIWWWWHARAFHVFRDDFHWLFFLFFPTLPISWVEILLWTKNNESEKKKEKRKIVKSRRKIALYIFHLSRLHSSFRLSLSLTFPPRLVMHNANSICDKLQSVVFMPCAGGLLFYFIFLLRAWVINLYIGATDNEIEILLFYWGFFEILWFKII
jgi:hypothetical protein